MFMDDTALLSFNFETSIVSMALLSEVFVKSVIMLSISLIHSFFFGLGISLLISSLFDIEEKMGTFSKVSCIFPLLTFRIGMPKNSREFLANTTLLGIRPGFEIFDGETCASCLLQSAINLTQN